MAGLFDYLNTTMSSPMFLAGGALMSGEGFSGAMQGMQAGQRSEAMRRQQEMERQRHQAYQGLFSDPKALQGIPMGAVNIARAAGPEVGLPLLAGMLPKPRDPLDEQYRRAQIAHMQAQTAVASRNGGAQTDDIREYLYAKGTGFGGSFLEYMQSKRVPQSLTATDKQAIIEADEKVAANRDAITALEQAQQLSPQANSGWGARMRATLGKNLPDLLVPDVMSSPQSSEATADYDNLVVGQALSQMKSIFGAAPTEGERKILLDLQASVNEPVEVRKRILDRAIKMAKVRRGFAEQQAEGLRGGGYYKPGGAPAQAAADQSAPVRVRSPDEARKLPSGTPIILPDGTAGVVP